MSRTANWFSLPTPSLKNDLSWLKGDWMQWDACMDEQTNKNTSWKCIRGASTDRWPRKNRDTVLSMQGWGQENQSPPGTQFVKGHEVQQVEFLWGISSKRKSRERVEDCCWMAQGVRWEMHARGKGTQCLYCLSLLMRLRKPATISFRLVEKYGAVKTYLWRGGGSNKGAFKQNQHAQIHGTWWAASTIVEGVGSHCKATLDYHLWRKNLWCLGEAPEDWKTANIFFLKKDKKVWGTAGWKALPLSWEDCGEKKSWNYFLNIVWTRWLGVVTELGRGNHAQCPNMIRW